MQIELLSLHCSKSNTKAYFCLKLLDFICFLFQLKTAREATNIALAGSAIGAISTAGFAWKYSRSLHGNILLILPDHVFYAIK